MRYRILESQTWKGEITHDGKKNNQREDRGYREKTGTDERIEKAAPEKGGAENRKARTKRLILIGAEVEKILGKPVEEKDLPKLKRFLESQESRGHYFTKAMADDDAEKWD